MLALPPVASYHSYAMTPLVGRGTHSNTETSGAVGPRGIRLLGQLAKDVQRKGAVEGTFYGTSRASTRSFFPHHLGSIASSIVRADALTLCNAAATQDYVAARPTGRTTAGA